MTKKLTNSAIIVAAGVGQRYGANKLLETIADVPVLIHSVRAFCLPQVQEIIVVAHESNLQLYQDLLHQYQPDPRIRLIPGGSERWQSSLTGIQAATGDIVAIHDAARPLITSKQITASLTTAAHTGACLVAAPATDSIKIVHAGVNTESLDRSTIYLAQTPQTFRRALILEAYARTEAAHFQQMTDESELITRFMGQTVTIIPSTNRNLKITYPGDLAVARALYAAATSTPKAS